jgi:rubrerythrin
MDECCIEFCKNLDEWIQDEESDEKKYHTWAKKARAKQPYIGIILEMISRDEGKHAMAHADVAMLVCKN